MTETFIFMLPAGVFLPQVVIADHGEAPAAIGASPRRGCLAAAISYRFERLDMKNVHAIAR